MFTKLNFILKKNQNKFFKENNLNLKKLILYYNYDQLKNHKVLPKNLKFKEKLSKDELKEIIYYI